MKETEQKKMGQWMTPEDIVNKMLDFAPVIWYAGNILEPTAGNGNIVIGILNKKVELGMTPQQAVDTTYMNEFDKDLYDKMVQRVIMWCDEHNVNIGLLHNHIFNEDARTLKLNVDYKVITNLPFGSWTNSSLPRQIINNLQKPAVYLTKWSTGCNQKYCKSVLKFENVVFPGIVYDCLLWLYDPNVVYEEPQVWIYWPIPRFPKHKLKKVVLTGEE